MKFEELYFDVLGDERGALIALQGNQQIPFSFQRVFYIYNVNDDGKRGCHANRKSEFVLICLHGKCRVKIRCDKEREEIVVLDSPNKGLWLDKMVWKEMYDFSRDAVLMVISNELYDPEEYVNDFEQYISEVSTSR